MNIPLLHHVSRYHEILWISHYFTMFHGKSQLQRIFFGWVNTHSKLWFRGISWQLFGEKITKWWVKGPPLVTFALQPRHRKPLQELQGDLPARATVASRHGTPKDLDGRVDLQMDWFFSQKNVGCNGYYIVKMFFFLWMVIIIFHLWLLLLLLLLSLYLYCMSLSLWN